MYSRQLQVFKELNDSLPEDITRKWSQEPIAAVLNDKGKWQSPMYAEEATGMLIAYIRLGCTRSPFLSAVISGNVEARKEQ